MLSVVESKKREISDATASVAVGGLDIVELSRRYFAAREKFSHSDFIPKLLSTLFGAATLSEKHNPAAFGIFRKDDLIIAEAVMAQIIKSQGQRPVRILELACGASYGDFYNRGAPWLSRILSQSFGSLVEVVASDLSKNDLQIIAVDQEGVLSSRLITPSKALDLGEITPLEATSRLQRCRGATWAALEAIEPEKISYLLKALDTEGAKYLFDQHGEPTKTIHLRPALDEVFERAMFGVQISRGVSYLNLESFWPENSFDIIFTRHLSFTQRSQARAILASANRVLSESGKVLICGDWTSYWDV